jgi:hypothetical protein
MKTELPVRSAVLKHRTGGLVVRWVTTSESPLLYVFAIFLLLEEIIMAVLKVELNTTLLTVTFCYYCKSTESHCGSSKATVLATSFLLVSMGA